MLTGTVRWFSPAYGYGFITDESGRDVFVHFSVILLAGYKSLDSGQVVGYEKEVGPKGERATLVVPDSEVLNLTARPASAP